MKKTYSCGAVVWRKNAGVLEILLIKQFSYKDSWGIPKGHINDGESFEECAKREVFEETGVTVELGQGLPECDTIWKNEHKVVVSFLAQAVGSDVPSTDNPDCEVAEAKWFNVSELPRIHVYQQTLIERTIDLLNQST